MIGTRGRGDAEKKRVLARAEAQRREGLSERRRLYLVNDVASVAALKNKAASPQAFLSFASSSHLCVFARANPSILLLNCASSRLRVNQKGAEA